MMKILYTKKLIRISFIIAFLLIDAVYFNILIPKSISMKSSANDDKRQVERASELENLTTATSMPISTTESEELKPISTVPYWIIVDGVIFELQGGNPKGISVVWKNLMFELNKLISEPDRLFYIERVPHLPISKSISELKHVTSLSFKGSIEQTIVETVNQAPENGIIVFISTYYKYPPVKLGNREICRVLMYHDLIPEHVGLGHGPGSEYWPRIEILNSIDSIISVSRSTSQDLIEHYPEKVKKVEGEPFFDSDKDEDELTRNTIISTIPNRISRTYYPGPAKSEDIQSLRAKYGIVGDEANPLFPDDKGVPRDYFLMVGSAYSYKNTATFFAALDLLSDEYLKRVRVVMVGRGGLTDEEMNALKKHPIRINGELFLSDRPSKVEIKAYHLGHIDDKDLPSLYSGALALVYISLYEGFGLPAAEAMTSGTLCILTASSSLPEVGGKSALYLDDAKNSEKLKDILIKAMTMTPEERKRRIELEMKHVEQFGGGGPEGLKHGWNEMARLVLKHFKSEKNRGKQCYEKGLDLKNHLRTSEECKSVCQCPFNISDDTVECRVGDSVFKQKHHKKFLCPQQFRDMADYIYGWNAGHHSERIHVESAEKVAPCLRHGAIIYAVGWHLDGFFNDVYPLIKNKFILITGESDLTVPFPHHLDYVTGDSKIIHWYGQNGGVIPENARFTHIPIGLNCFEHTTALTTALANFKNDVLPKALPEALQEPTKYQLPEKDPLNIIPQRTFKKWLLINFDPSTDGTGERRMLVNQLCNQESPKNWLSFADCIIKDTGVRQYMNSMYDIYKRNLEYPFWLSPRGNGIDCHRTYEALYMGRIPILKRSEISHIFDNLPVMIVEDWDVISEQFLTTEYLNIMKGRRDGIYKYEKIFIDYWETLILQKSAYSSLAPRPNRCWRPS